MKRGSRELISYGTLPELVYSANTQLLHRGLRIDLNALRDLTERLEERKPCHHPQLIRMWNAGLRPARSEMFLDQSSNPAESVQRRRRKAADACRG
jgi:hypothetical protein